MTEDLGGPYVALACLCERVLVERDGVHSLIRIVDRLTFSGGKGAAEQMPPVTINSHLILNLKAGSARGNHQMRMLLISPDGAEIQQMHFNMLFEGDDRGAQAVIKLQIQVQEEGLYWFEIYFEGGLLTRIPLRLIWQRLAT